MTMVAILFGIKKLSLADTLHLENPLAVASDWTDDFAGGFI
jgi:hypothetical protein